MSYTRTNVETVNAMAIAMRKALVTDHAAYKSGGRDLMYTLRPIDHDERRVLVGALLTYASDDAHAFESRCDALALAGEAIAAEATEFFPGG